jgi:proteasome activator pa28 beta subunit
MQEEMVGELGRAEEQSFMVLEAYTKYYATRAKLISKVIKYPGIEDYRLCVKGACTLEVYMSLLCSGQLLVV